MTAFAVTYRLRAETKDLSPSEAEALNTHCKRIVASDAQRAISSLVNQMKRDGEIITKTDVKVLEVKVIP